MEETKDNNGLILNFALNYGSRAEIAQAMQKIAQQVQEGTIIIRDINEELISKHLMTSDLPEPDLLIRTSGEVRLVILCYGNWLIQSFGLRIHYGQILMKLVY